MIQQLRDKVAFDSPVSNPDGRGGTEDGWQERYVCHAEFIYSRGSEAIDAARLQGRSFFKVKIRQCATAKEVTTAWRMRDDRRGTEYQIREVDSITDRLWIYIVVESGVAV